MEHLIAGKADWTRSRWYWAENIVLKHFTSHRWWSGTFPRKSPQNNAGRRRPA